MNARHFSFPESLEKNLESLLNKSGLSLENSAQLASQVEPLSHHFTTIEGQKTPWEHWAAYMVYFFPLNVTRLRAVFEESFRDFPWERVSSIVDFGSGPGTAHAAFEATTLAPKNILSVETDHKALSLHRDLNLTAWPNDWDKKLPSKFLPGTLGVFSYSLLEEPAVERRLKEFDHLLIITPSTRAQGRRLLELRQSLQLEGFSSWAPCTHQEACPLLAQSKTDWCHDRISFDAPEWFKKLESHLPNYNHTLTFSYWFGSRTEKPVYYPRAARLIGDTLYEKGKVRQMMCRGPNREFLAWLTRHGEPAPLARGSIFELPENPVLKGNEIRL
jgi:hypothetical protein